jgi:hypothetical protein
LYELNGFNREALDLIKKAIVINPESHDGSEWVHVKVLEAKLKLEKDKDWLSKNKVLNLNIENIEKTFANGAVPEDSILSKSIDSLYHIQYQLQERIPFTPVPDLLMANILSETGELFAKEKSVIGGYVYYHIGLKYDPQDHYNFRKKIIELRASIQKLKLEVPSDREVERHFAEPGLQNSREEDFGPSLDDNSEKSNVSEEDSRGNDFFNTSVLLGILGLAGLIGGIILIRREG